VLVPHGVTDTMTVVAKWVGAPDPAGDDVYNLEIWGKHNLLHTITTPNVKVRFTMERRRIRARVNACDPDGCGPYSMWSAWLEGLPADTLDMQNIPGDGSDR